jgi:hypothetical protein
MTCIPIKDGIVCLAEIDFYCPTCKKAYSDSDEKYINRCLKNKSGCARIKCECGKSFYMTYDMTGKAVSFIHEKQ